MLKSLLFIDLDIAMVQIKAIVLRMILVIFLVVDYQFACHLLLVTLDQGSD